MATKQWKPVKFMAIPLMWNHEYMEVLGDMSARAGGTLVKIVFLISLI